MFAGLKRWAAPLCAGSAGEGPRPLRRTLWNHLWIVSVENRDNGSTLVAVAVTCRVRFVRGCALKSSFHLSVIALLLLGSGVGFAQNDKPTVVPVESARAQRLSDRKVPLLDRALRLEDFSTMSPADALSARLAEMSEFTQNQPNNGKPPTQRTVAYVGRTRTSLQVAFVCFDTRPEAIRRHLARRENVQGDDNVAILLDPFADRRHGVLFQVNPLGVQADAAWSETNDPDYSYDQVWDSAAEVTTKGWIAVLSIPFESLRFRSGGLPWGMVMMRNLPRTSETDTWPAISSNTTGTLSQEGTLTGIEGVTGSHNVQLNPYGLVQNDHELNTQDSANPYFSSRRLEGTVGGDVKAIVKDAIVLDATINPDFSQVESDQPQFTVNQRYAVYFPELRPFFLENATYFDTPIQLVYTRNIVHPEFGGRATGKIGRTNIGFLAIDDRAPGEGVSQDDPLHGKKALFGIGRVSEDLGKNSNVGVTYTDEEFAGSWNRIGGVDFSARLNDKWTLNGQEVVSSTKGLDSSYAAGPATKVQIVRQSHSLDFRDTYRDYSGGFQSQVGFIQTTAFRQNSDHFNYQWFPKKHVQSIGIEQQAQFAFDRQGNRIYHYTTVDPFVTLTRSTTVATLVGQNSDTLGPSGYANLTSYKNYTENFGGVVIRSAPVPQVNVNIVALRGGNVNYNPIATVIPSLLDQNFLQALITFQPIGALTIDNTYLLDRDFLTRGGPFVYESQTLRTKLNYQFTRAMSARVIVEYDSTLVNPLQTSLVRTKQVGTQALFTWLPHPGTAIYVGYNNDLQNLNHTVCTRLGSMCDPGQPILGRANGYLNDGRQFFVKVSYLLRF